jgi:hypothetical protein
MTRLLTTLLGITVGTCCLAQDTVRVATIHSSFREGKKTYKDDFTPLLAELGWQEDQYENTDIAALVPRLADYELVIGCSVFNYDNQQDLARYAEQWRQYLTAGGCLLLTDVNYPQQANWLPSVDPELRWRPSGFEGQYDGSASIVLADHPLLRDVPAPSIPWTYPLAWSQSLTALAVDPERRPVVAYGEIGAGIVVISSTYRQNKWPNAAFLRNLLTWSRDEERRAKVARRDETRASAELPRLAVPLLDRLPTVDGELSDGEWDQASQTAEFLDWRGEPGLTQRTRCFVAHGADALYVAFECSDSDLGNVVRNVTERDGGVWSDDCVEVFLDPTGSRESFWHFTVTAGGAMADELNGSLDGDRYWTAAVSEKPGAWCAEICIPFSSVDISAASPAAELWAANFCREYQGRSGIGQELSCWSPTMGSFHNMDRFGTLTGIQVDAATYTCNPQIAVSAPERWYVGDNTVTAEAAAITDRSAEVQVACIDLVTGEEGGRRQSVTVPGNGTAQVTLGVPVATDGKHLRQTVAFDANTPTRVLASGPVLHITTAPLMDIAMVSPPYRNLIQSRDPMKELRLEGSVGDTDAPGLKVRASLFAQGKWTPQWQTAVPVQPRSDFEFSEPLDKLPVGDYTVRLDLIDVEGRLLSCLTEKLSVAAPAPFEVTFDAKQACYVNGRPFFPIGLYHVGERSVAIINSRARELGLPEISMREAMESLRDRGFNCIHNSWAMPGEDYITMAAGLGLMVVPEVGGPDEATLTGLVETANRHGNLLHWYGIDEAHGENLQRAKAAYERYRRLDPHRPVMAACCNPSLFSENLQAYDVLMMDPYLIRHAPLSGVAGWIERGKAAAGGRTPIWLVPQAFTIDSHWSEPTNDELCCQAYLGLIHGAKALFWYAYYTSEKYSDNKNDRGHWFLPESHLWDYFPVLNAEVQALSEVVLTGNDRGSAKTSTEAIHCCVWEHGGKHYLLAVNAESASVECEFSGLEGGAVQVMFEDREAQITEGRLKERFEGYGRHVYVY